jgi:hypothetical protein
VTDNSAVLGLNSLRISKQRLPNLFLRMNLHKLSGHSTNLDNFAENMNLYSTARRLSTE